MGQPRSSKSTGTCSATGVDIFRVLMKSGLAYTRRTNSPTSFQFRSACSPPEVAHTPMVTSVRHCRRICWMRSASWCVVMEPSGKYTISTASATSSSSSSASNSVNWQPSQEANLNTATVGFRPCPFSSELIFSKPGPDLVIRKDRPVFAQEVGTVLAMAAEADAAFHVALERNMQIARLQAARLQFPDHVPHHDLRPADQRYRVEGLQPHVAEQARHHPHVPVPGYAAVVHRG